MNSITKHHGFLTVITIAYALLTLVMVILHEPWRDEAHAWLLARDLSFPSLLSIMPLEGTPALWHSLLFILNALGLPYFSMFILHWIIAVRIVYVFVRYSPFTTFINILFVLTYFISYEYVVVARNYNMGILCLFMLVAFSNQKTTRPWLWSLLLVLMVNSFIHYWGAALALFLIFVIDLYKENKLKQNLLPIIVVILGAIAAFIQVWGFGKFQLNGVVNNTFFPEIKISQLFVLNRIMEDVFTPLGLFLWENKKGLFFFLFFFCFVLSFAESPRVFFFLVLSLLWMFYIFFTRHEGALRHHGLVLMIMAASLWLDYNRLRPFRSRILRFFRTFSFLVLLASWLVQIPQVVIFWKDEILYSYSGSKEAAVALKHLDKENVVFVTPNSFVATPICPYFSNAKFHAADIRKDYTFFYLDSASVNACIKLTNDSLISYFRSLNDKEKQYYLMLNKPLPPENINGFSLIYSTIGKVFRHDEELFYVYEPKKKD